jgi:tungstate transport system ATP-binding protein
MSLGLETLHLRKSYDNNEVLQDCSFPVSESGIHVLTGPNGCGKSTFLRICSLLEEPDSGEVRYFSGANVVEKDLALRRRISLVLPRVGPFNTTVFSNISYGLAIRGIKGKEAAERTLKALEFVGLGHKRGQRALALSSGETQRLGIARALAIQPEILFLDEPTASVDRKNTDIIEEIIIGMKQAGRPMVIMTTHDQRQAEKLADTLFVLRDGRLFQG